MSRLLYLYKKQSLVYPVKYGLFYNWYATTDARNIMNTGWHVPTGAEWLSLFNYLGYSVCGGKLKETGLTYWNSPNTGATNEVGFNARGSGSRIGDTGSFYQLSQYFITNAGAYPYQVSLAYNSITYVYTFGNPKQGTAIRLVKDSTTLSDGEYGTYTGNDGKIYRTICINGQEWLADNLAETKYRNGDSIPEVTDNAAWAALTTGAMCAYNNDWSNV